MRAPGTSTRILSACLLLLAAISSAAGGGIAIENRLFLGEWSPFGSRWESESPVCVWGGDGASFRVTAVGSVAGGAFVLDAGPGARLGYRVHWYPDGRDGPREEMTAGVPSRQAVTANETARCRLRGPRSLVRVSIDARELRNSPPGAYDGELVLTLSPL